MATTTTAAHTLRSRFFGGQQAGPASAAIVAHTNDALRQATDRLLKEQSEAELTVSLYRQKLGEAQSTMKVLEEAYRTLAKTNGQLQGAERRRGCAGRRRASSCCRCHGWSFNARANYCRETEWRLRRARQDGAHRG